MSGPPVWADVETTGLDARRDLLLEAAVVIPDAAAEVAACQWLVAPVLTCGHIHHRRFTVLPPDPHRFDGNRNGIGCRS